MSDDEVCLLVDDLQNGTGQLDNELKANALVDIKSTQGESEGTSVNKLSTFLTVPVYEQPQATLSGKAIFYGRSCFEQPTC
uniref:GAF domain-containing protein n=1 Tax=Angiostrongylus cantonensis TaxID=6313 RepID=A0A0K0DRM5_ANGCA